MNLILVENKIAKNAVILASLLLLAGASDPSWSRGGGGGGGMRGGGGGGFGGGRGFGGYGDRGYGDRGYGDYGGDRGYRGAGAGYMDGRDSGDMFGDGNVLSHTSESALRDGANQVWNSGGDRGLGGGLNRSLASTGFGGNRVDNSVSRAVSPATLANRGEAVRGAFRANDAFRGDWWGRHPGLWWNRGWGDAWAWDACGWGDLAGFWDYPVDNQPVDYDYGNNITYQGDTVYYGTQPTDTAANYYTQAQDLAQSAPPEVPVKGTASKPGAAVPAALAAAESKDAKDWKSLGVFSLTQGDQTDSSIMFQLAVNKKGIVRGNYYNMLTQETKPLSGAVDKKNMRVAWEVEGAKTTVYDTGLSNLLHAQSPILVHFSKSRTEQWNLIKLNQPKT